MKSAVPRHQLSHLQILLRGNNNLHSERKVSDVIELRIHPSINYQ